MLWPGFISEGSVLYWAWVSTVNTVIDMMIEWYNREVMQSENQANTSLKYPTS